MLKTMMEEGESAADGLLVCMQKLSFIALCIILKNCFAISGSVSEYLQCENMDLVSAVSGVQSRGKNGSVSAGGTGLVVNNF